MGLLDLLIGRSANKPDPSDLGISRVREVEVKTIEVGSTGTEIYSGYIHEEYLKELNGPDWADKIDMMRRSDTNIKMVLSAIKLPLKSSPWTISIKTDVTDEQKEAAELQQKLISKIIFDDLNISFTGLIGEILTCIDFGYSIFDITHAVKTDPVFGTYNTLKAIGYRSQRTIERWNLNGGHLQTVTQIADGDLGGSFELDARFLLHFAPEKEGQNYEGISILRACYGPWLRKNEFLKKLAVGIEKYAVPTPTLKVPPGTEGQKEYQSVKKALQCYTSGAANYLIIPQGFDLTFNNVSVDVEKIRAAINAENQEMVNSILASFLLLGQNGAGSLALSGTLSDFFSQTVQYIADHISEQFERKIFKPLIKMNFGTDTCYVDLKCDGLEHRANESWSNMVNAFLISGAIIKDEDLEKNLREKLKLPPKMKQENINNENIIEPVQLAEKKKNKNYKEANLIRDTADRIRSVTTGILPTIAEKYIASVMSKKIASNQANAIKAPLMATVPSVTQYAKIIQTPLMIAAIEAQGIQEKLFKPKNKKLSEFRLAADKFKKVTDAVNEYERALERLAASVTAEEKSDAIYALGRISDKVNLIFANYLSYDQKQRTSAAAEVLADVQKNDLVKAIDLQFQNSIGYASDDELEQDMLDAATKVISGPTSTSGPDVQASQAVNQALKEEAEKYADETGDEIVSYTFIAVDDDVTTDICRELNNATFSADDPNIERYSPPLHFNCRSFLGVNTSSMRNNPEITGLPKLSKSAQSQIQFSESTFELAEYKGKQVELDKPFRTPDGPKKFSVYVKNDLGNIVKVNFGDPNMEIKRDDLDRRKSFRARHKCDIDPGPKWKAKYWSCKFWSDEKIGDLL